MTAEEWDSASTFEKDNAIKNATETKHSENLDRKIYNEVTAMHKKVTFMFIVTIISLVISIVSGIVAYNYISKINKAFNSFNTGLENSLDDYNLDD